MLYRFLILGLLFLLNFSGKDPIHCDAKDVFFKMLAANKKFETGFWTLKKSERLRSGEYFSTEVITKLNVNPFKVYIYGISPNPGTEILFCKGQNNDKVILHPNRFPYVNLNLSPENSILQENQHHPIFHMGFEYIISILKHTMELDPEFFFKNLVCEEEVEWDRKKFYKLVGVNPNFTYNTYIVQKGDNVISIARKFYVNEYMILCANKNISDYSNLKLGQKILVPNAYAKKIILYVDKVNFQPLFQGIYDEKGLYEQYEFRSFIYNYHFQPDEFTTKFKGYGF